MPSPDRESPPMRSVHDAFLRQVSLQPDAEALVFPNHIFTYADLDRAVAAFARKFAECGVGPGSLLMLQSNQLIAVMATFLAASYLGAAVVERNDEQMVPSAYPLTHHFHTGVSKSSYPPMSRHIDPDWSPASVAPGYPPAPTFSAQADYFFTFSSGSTGLPKVIPLSHEAVLKRSEATAVDFKSGHTRLATLLPVGSRPFMARALGIMVNGATLIDGTDHNFWLEKGVNFVSGSARQMQGFFQNLTLPKKIHEVEVLGSRIATKDVLHLLGSFNQVQDTIGASEASKFFVNRHRLDQTGTHQVAGQLLDSQVEILDVMSGQPTKMDEGVLRVQNAYLAKHYIGDEKATQQSFRDGWFYTGDSARWGANGTLEVSDRTNNVINIGGMKIHGALIDRVLRSTRGIRDAIAFKNPKPGAADEVFAFVIFDEGANQLQAMEVAKLRIEELLGSSFVPRVIRGVAGLPRLPDGTADRQACAKFILELAAARGTLNNQASG